MAFLVNGVKKKVERIKDQGERAFVLTVGTVSYNNLLRHSLENEELSAFMKKWVLLSQHVLNI